MKIYILNKKVPWSLNGDSIPFFWRNFNEKLEWVLDNYDNGLERVNTEIYNLPENDTLINHRIIIKTKINQIDDLENVNYALVYESKQSDLKKYKFYFIRKYKKIENNVFELELLDDIIFNNIELYLSSLSERIMVERSFIDRFINKDSKHFNWSSSSLMNKRESFLNDFNPTLDSKFIPKVYSDKNISDYDKPALIAFLGQSAFTKTNTGSEGESLNSEGKIQIEAGSDYNPIVDKERLVSVGGLKIPYGIVSLPLNNLDDDFRSKFDYDIYTARDYSKTEYSNDSGESGLSGLKPGFINQSVISRNILSATILPYTVFSDKYMNKEFSFLNLTEPPVDENYTTEDTWTVEERVISLNENDYNSMYNFELETTSILSDYFVPKQKPHKDSDFSFKNEPKMYQSPITKLHIEHISKKDKYEILPENLIWEFDSDYHKTFTKDNYLNLIVNFEPHPLSQSYYVNFDYGAYKEDLIEGNGFWIQTNYQLPINDSSVNSFNKNFKLNEINSKSENYSNESIMFNKFSSNESSENYIDNEFKNQIIGKYISNNDSQEFNDLLSDILSSENDNFDQLKIKLSITTATDNQKFKMASFFHRYGYEINSILNMEDIVNSRYYFNYIKSLNTKEYYRPNLINDWNLSQVEIDLLSEKINNGLRLWHQESKTSVNFDNYSKDNTEIYREILKSEELKNLKIVETDKEEGV